MRVEPYNFSEHLKTIVFPRIKEKGFKRKGNRFVRINGNVVEEIFFQRSQFNVNGYPFKFFLNISIKVLKEDGKWQYYSDTRLEYPTQMKIPPFYLDYIKKHKQGISVNFEDFSEEQKNEASTYVRSGFWSYDTEEELVHKLTVAVNEIESKGFDLFTSFMTIIDESKSKNKSDIEIQRELHKLRTKYVIYE